MPINSFNFKVDGPFLTYLRDKATSFENDAGYSGRMDDGGARELREAVEIYISGRERSLPQAWAKYAVEYQKMIEPEYQEYLRLKAKFGDHQ